MHFVFEIDVVKHHKKYFHIIKIYFCVLRNFSILSQQNFWMFPIFLVLFPRDAIKNESVSSSETWDHLCNLIKLSCISRKFSCRKKISTKRILRWMPKKYFCVWYESYKIFVEIHPDCQYSQLSDRTSLEGIWNILISGKMHLLSMMKIECLHCSLIPFLELIQDMSGSISVQFVKRLKFFNYYLKPLF